MFVDASLITRDGTELVSRVWRPRGSGPWPALLMRQPYGRAIASTVTLPHPDWWCSHGFLVVVQDVRGQGGLRRNIPRVLPGSDGHGRHADLAAGDG